MRVHFLGIGGSGASAIAAIAMSQGFEVTGCDKNQTSSLTKIFNKKNLFDGHSPKHLEGIDILAITPAISYTDPKNPELLEAKKKEIPIMTWQEFMGKYLERGKFVIAVCGTHGKSTTTAMIGQLLEDTGLDPTVELGATVPRWKSNFRVGKSRFFITEADEFNDNFLASKPEITVVTYVEMDHPEYFKDFDSYKKSFARFLLQTKRIVVANLANSGVRQTLALIDSKLEIIGYSKSVINFPLKVIGEFNIANASAAYQVGLALGIKPGIIKKNLSNFEGIGKRFEKLGEFQGAEFYDDFAHHPTEVEVTLKAAREKYPKSKIWLIYQPHMFSRTKVLFKDFVRIFKKAPVNHTIIVDIYPGREVDTGVIHSRDLVKAVNKKYVIYMNDMNLLEENIRKYIGKGDVVIFMGAGPIDQLALKLINEK